MKDEPLSDLLIQASINTDNQLMVLSDSSCQYFPDTGRITGVYIIFYHSGKIYHGTHVPGPVDQSSTESEYNVACTAVMDLANSSMLVYEFLNKDTYLVP